MMSSYFLYFLKQITNIAFSKRMAKLALLSCIFTVLAVIVGVFLILRGISTLTSDPGITKV